MPEPIHHRRGDTPASPADEEMPPDEGRPLILRLLALVGALSFLLLGLSVVTPLLQPAPKQPQPLPGSNAPSA